MTWQLDITPEIQEAYLDHQAFCSAGQSWLVRNDPDGWQEAELIDRIRDLVQAQAQDRFGEDDEAFDAWSDQYLRDTQAWWDLLEQAIEHRTRLIAHLREITDPGTLWDDLTGLTRSELEHLLRTIEQETLA